jgi:hypothetical protein
MLSDVFNTIGNFALLLGLLILSFASYRAVVIGRALMRGAYRSRAFWSGAAMLVIIISTLAGVLPVPFPVLLVPIMIILLAFVDSSIRVAQEMDFFHRNTLGWQIVRKPFYVILLASSVLFDWALLFTSVDSLPTLLAAGQYFAVVGLVLSYSAAALIVGARRTPERTMRRFVRMLGLAIVCVVVYLTIWIPFSPFNADVQDLGNMISFFFIPGAAYFFYRAVMSLSPLGRVEKDPVATKLGGSGAVPSQN